MFDNLIKPLNRVVHLFEELLAEIKGLRSDLQEVKKVLENQACQYGKSPTRR